MDLVNSNWWQWPALAILASIIAWMAYTMERERKSLRETLKEERETLAREASDIASERKEYVSFIYELIKKSDEERVHYLANLDKVVSNIQETMTSVTVNLAQILDAQAALCESLRLHDSEVQRRIGELTDSPKGG